MMKTVGRRKNSARKLAPPEPVAPDLGPFARKLDAAFREIVQQRVTIREVEVPDPSGYDADAIRATRRRLGVSAAVFARLVGVSAKLVEHWEQGRREPAPLARRLLDRINADPAGYLADLMKRREIASATFAHRTPAARGLARAG